MPACAGGSLPSSLEPPLAAQAGRRGGGEEGGQGRGVQQELHAHLFLALPGKPPVLTCRQAHPRSEIISSLGPGISKEALTPPTYSLGWVSALIPRSGALCQQARPAPGGTDPWAWAAWRTPSSMSWNNPPSRPGERPSACSSCAERVQLSRVRSFPCLDSAPNCVPESSAWPHHCPLHRHPATRPGGSSSLT